MTSTSPAPLFTNSARPQELDSTRYPGDYGYDCPSPLLFNFGTLLQAVISQAGTYRLTKKFHDHQCGIYKSEGGCNIVGVGDLVLGSTCCYWDYARRGDPKSDKTAALMAELITKVVLNWDPMRPVDSMIETAAVVAGCEEIALRVAVFNDRSGGPFGGNALSDFFNWNPFAEAPIQEDYERWCWVNVHGGAEAEIVQRQADRARGKVLLGQINNHIRAAAQGLYVSTALCCSPRRFEDGALHFWINTGRSTQIDGWKTEADIAAFLASDGVLVDERR